MFVDFTDIEKFQNQYPWKRFIHLSNENLEKSFYKVCEELGAFPELETIIHILLANYTTQPENRKEIILITNYLLTSPNISIIQKKHLIQTIIEVYFEPEHWNLETLSTEQVQQIKHNSVVMCLMLEGIGIFATSIGKNYEAFMLQSLHLILEKCGSTQSIVGLAAMKSLNQIRIASNQDSISELISTNVDYLRYFIIQKLKHIERYPQVIDTLNFIMLYCTIEILPFLQEIISDVVLTSCDKLQNRNASIFLRLFNIFVNCCARWKIEAPKPIQVENSNDVVDFFEKVSEAADEYKEDEDMMEEEMVEKEEFPVEIQLTSDIMKRCLHFLPTKDRDRKLLSLDTLAIGIEIVKDYENISLRVAHLIWSPLVTRFDEVDALILNRSFNLLLVMARCTNTFIRKRTLE